MRFGILTSHPIQYQAPFFRALAKEVELEVFFAHKPDAIQQGVGFGKSFSWDVDLLSGYRHRFLNNVSHNPSADRFFGCDTPEIAGIIAGGQMSEVGGQGSGVRSQWSVVSGHNDRRFDAFIVSGWHLKTYWQAVRACRRAGVPVLVRGDSQLHSPRSWIKRWAKELVYRPLLRQFDGFLVVGKRNREYLAHYGVPESKMFSVPHFVDNEWFAVRAAEARSRRSEVRGQWGADDSTLVALFVGKFMPEKRPADLLKAVAKLQARRRSGGLATGQDTNRSVPTVIPVFAGSGELESALRAQAEALGVRAVFLGFKNQSELPTLYMAADVLVLPSESETWGLVVNEAMACGLPAIISDAVGCGPDLIDEGRTGYSYPVGDSEALAAWIGQVAGLVQFGYDFAPALAVKMRSYSEGVAVSGTLGALGTAEKSRRSNP